MSADHITMKLAPFNSVRVSSAVYYMHSKCGPIEHDGLAALMEGTRCCW